MVPHGQVETVVAAAWRKAVWEEEFLERLRRGERLADLLDLTDAIRQEFLAYAERLEQESSAGTTGVNRRA